MPTSRARVIGHLQPPTGLTWAAALADPTVRAHLILDFLGLTARALDRPTAQIAVHQQLWLDGAGGASMHEGRWHFDAAHREGHVVCVLGDDPTEFLLGDFPAACLQPGHDLGHLADQLERWTPEAAAAVLIDRYTIHRRPPGHPRARLFLLGARAAPDPPC